MKLAFAGGLDGSHDSTFSFVSSPTPGGVQEVGSVRKGLRGRWVGNGLGPYGVPGSPPRGESHRGGIPVSSGASLITAHRCASWTGSAGSPHSATLTPSTGAVLTALRARTLTAYSPSARTVASMLACAPK